MKEREAAGSTDILDTEIQARRINAQTAECDRQLRQQFGSELFVSGWCLLLGRHYGQSKTIYFSLNPGFPRSGAIVDPSSTAGWNVPFANPPDLQREYVYLHNCQRFFGSDEHLSRWINARVTSAFLVPWRTRNMSELLKLNAATQGRLFAYAREIVRSIIEQHEAELLIVAGKAALRLIASLGVLDEPLEIREVFGPGGSYQWCKTQAKIGGRVLTILQIPHFSRANSPLKMAGCRAWILKEAAHFGCGPQALAAHE